MSFTPGTPRTAAHVLSSALVFALAAVALAAGCGGTGGGSPTAPSGSTVTSITITSSGGVLFLGATETFTATAQRSDGSSAPLTGGTWGSDAPQVATAAGAGQVTGVGSGEATIFVDASGVRGTKRIRVLPRYEGNWIGSYVVTGCSETGTLALAELCDGVFPIDNVLPLAFQFTQADTAVSGRAALGQILSDAFSAPVDGAGGLRILVGASSSTLSFAETWDLRITQPGRITGTLRFVVRDTVLSGSVTVDARLINTNVQGAATTGMRLPVSPAWTLETLGEAVRGR